MPVVADSGDRGQAIASRGVSTGELAAAGLIPLAERGEPRRAAVALNDTDPTPEYRPVSRLAVTGLALSVASLCVLVSPLGAAVVPAVAAVVCVAAILRIRRDPSLAGLAIAQAGLALAVFALAAGPTFWVVRNWQLRRTAEQVAAKFVKRLVEGDMRAAHQMTLPAKERFASDKPLADSYRDDAAARDRLAEFSRDPVVERLRSLRGAAIESIEVAWHDALPGIDGFGIHVRVAAESPASSVTVRVLVERRAGASPGDWIVTKQLLED